MPMTFETINPKKFLRKIGVKRRTFLAIVKLVNASLAEERRQQPMRCRGKQTTTISVTNRVLLTLYYLRQYPTFEELGDRFGVSESYANKLYHRHLDILVKVLRLPGKKSLLDQELVGILIDVTEQPVERPVKKQRQWFSGKKQRHTLKTQLIVCLKTLQILLVVCDKGRTHDFKMLKRAALRIATQVKKYGDAGYQGLQKMYANSTTPHKKPKGGELTKAQKQENRDLARLRVPIEHVNRWCKIFRAVKETYRGKHKNSHKTWTVAAALVNLRYGSDAPQS